MVSVEYAHFLGEEEISEYHWRSHEEFLKIEKAKGIILLDDYNFKVSEDFKIKKFNSPIVLESKMTIHTKKLISLLNIEDTETIHFKGILLKKNNHWTCPTLTACWYLARLGFFKDDKITPHSSLINILPEKFKSNEEKVLKILKHINSNLNEKVNYIFIEETK